MTTADRIKETGYTEKELIYIALKLMRSTMREDQKSCCDNDGYFDPEVYEHYGRLAAAYDAMIEEMRMEYDIR